ncbi:MAG: aspartyl protease family protein, partial [Candidatus Zixiibacteriota bacterium]
MKVLLIHLLIFVCSLKGEVVPFEPSRGLVEVKVTIDGRVKGNFGIDTGADRLYINKSFAEKNQLTFRRSTPQRDIVGVDGTSNASAVSLRSLKIGNDETLYNLRATAIDLKALVKDPSRGYPDGLIGHEILSRFYVTVDYPHKQMELLSFEPDFLMGKKYYEIPFKQYRHLILVDVVFNDDITVPMILDYCASYTTISSSLAKRLDIKSSDISKMVSIKKITIGEKITAS